MTAPLKERLVRHITMNGPLPLAEYMHWCLADKTHGYYQTQNVLGRTGDFITAPEISQMFGELIAVWLIETWRTIGRPEAFNLVELGPGKGTLMRDILRASTLDQAFANAAKPVMIETSELLIREQKNTLTDYPNISWHKTIDSLETLPSLLFANEFLDALPPRQYVKHNQEWYERGVGINEANELSWVAIPTNKLETSALPQLHEQEPDGSILEISTIRESFIERIATLVGQTSGAALIIDYGHAQTGFGDTFQAIAKHQFADPLEAPGEADLTSHVDFEPLVKTAKKVGCNPFAIMSQGEFLLKLGLLERAGSLGAGKSADEQARITQEAERLALPEEMGDLFKVFAFSSNDKLWPFSEIA